MGVPCSPQGCGDGTIWCPLAYTGQSVADGWLPPTIRTQGERGLEQAHHHSPGLDQVIF